VNGNHFVGACGVGRVLDADLKVIGFSNLRVVDASAIPEMPANSGPASSVYMLAEHVSDMIISASGATGARQSTPHAHSCPIYVYIALKIKFFSPRDCTYTKR
jgi:choline dehydrogenase-like flavoprotein